MHYLSRRAGSAAAAIIVIIAILAIVGGAVWYFVVRSTPEKAVTTLLEAVAANDQEILRDALTERSQDLGPMAAGPIGMSGGAEQEWEVGEATIEGDRARVPVTFPLPEQMRQFSATSEVTVNYVTHKVEGTWKVDLQDTVDTIIQDLMQGGGLTPPEVTEP